MFHQVVGIGYKVMKNHQKKKTDYKGRRSLRLGRQVAANPSRSPGRLLSFFFWVAFDYNLVYTQD